MEGTFGEKGGNVMILRRRVKRRLLIILGVVLLLGTVSATGAYAIPLLKNIIFVVFGF